MASSWKWEGAGFSQTNPSAKADRCKQRKTSRGYDMADLNFVIRRGITGKLPNGQGAKYNDVVSYHIASMDFPDFETAGEFEECMQFLREEFFRHEGLAVINTAWGRMYGCQYRFKLMRWIKQRAAELGAIEDYQDDNEQADITESREDAREAEQLKAFEEQQKKLAELLGGK